jgi:hypothetical protein
VVVKKWRALAEGCAVFYFYFIILNISFFEVFQNFKTWVGPEQLFFVILAP